MNNGERLFPKYLSFKNAVRAVLSILAGLVAASVFLLAVPKTYVATTKVFVDVADVSIFEQNYDFVYGSKNLAASYNNYLTTDFLTDAAHAAMPEKYANKYSAAEFHRMVSAEVVRQTNTIHVKVAAPDESDARYLSDFYTAFAFDYIIGLTKAGTYKIYESGTVADVTVLPYTGLTLMLGSVIGLAAAVIYTMLERYTDFDIETVKELERAAPGVALIGTIPTYYGEDSTKKLVVPQGASVEDMLLQNGFYVSYTKAPRCFPCLNRAEIRL